MNEQLISFVSQWLTEQQEPMTALLQELVNIDSYSHNQAGRLQIAQHLQRDLSREGITAELLQEHDTYAVKALVGNVDGPLIVLSGHMDTVFVTGEVKKRPFTQEGDKAFGPGVADMKSGLVMNCFILKAFHYYQQTYAQALPFQVMLLATSDEEIGSPNGRKVIAEQAKGAVAVFNAEPGRISGNVVNARKGGSTYQFDITGRASHAGVSHQDGISAIGILAKLITNIHQLTDYERGITTNVGGVTGGTTPNTVAQKATASLDVRYLTVDQGAWLEAQITQCVADASVAGASIQWHKKVGFVPFEQKMSQDLLKVYRQQAKAIGFEIDGEFTGGCSDAGWTSAMNIPTLCATGPVGGYTHTEREFCDLTTLTTRALIVARCCCAIGCPLDTIRR
ncbi:M20 family metallopeptidase [Celerinatantimonas diazotrophica]|uniref:Glutamate carboxypeptidase n=1 Tax=Celerinatantimonas diazotrophica TaxID=412034 RepID=A0A4V2PRF5_9GAMM|nr:M20 family metallopeptidase [Celerinatantimonas diazotrophica]TCK58621.1 glutamate carboxypeptidase [Celerinatantimonas diazotrophica]CAG9297250.1 Carboxypeptidase G2 [Celerinatantimonas diazotrophica]